MDTAAKLIGGARSKGQALVRQLLSGMSLVDLVGRLTIIFMLVFYCHKLVHWPTAIMLTLLGGMALLIPSLCKSRFFWTAIAAIHGLYLVGFWVMIDNHQFLIGYWFLLLAVTYSFPESERENILKKNSAWLLAIVFLMACAQKMTSGEFLNGDFLAKAFVTDRRFNWLGPFFNMDLKTIVESNWELINYFKGTTTSVQLTPPNEALAMTAKISAISSLGFQFMLGILFLAPDRPSIVAVRSFLLFSFCFLLFNLVPIFAFGAILCLLGLSQTTDSKISRGAFIILFFGLIANVMLPIDLYPYLPSLFR